MKLRSNSGNSHYKPGINTPPKSPTKRKQAPSSPRASPAKKRKAPTPKKNNKSIKRTSAKSSKKKMIRAQVEVDDIESEEEVEEEDILTALQATKYAKPGQGPKGSLEDLIKVSEGAVSTEELLKGMRKEMEEGAEKGEEEVASKVLRSKEWKGAEEGESAGDWTIRPELGNKFRPGQVKSLIESTIKEELEGKTYSRTHARPWVISITNKIMERVKELKFERYRIVVYVVIGENKGEGVFSCSRTMFDPEADSNVSYTYINDSLFCYANVTGIYVY